MFYKLRDAIRFSVTYGKKKRNLDKTMFTEENILRGFNDSFSLFSFTNNCTFPFITWREGQITVSF